MVLQSRVLRTLSRAQEHGKLCHAWGPLGGNGAWGIWCIWVCVFICVFPCVWPELGFLSLSPLKLPEQSFNFEGSANVFRSKAVSVLTYLATVFISLDF